MQVADIMRTTVIKVRPEAPIGHVLIWYGGMDHIFRNTYVVDQRDRLLGVVTIRKFLSLLVPSIVCDQAKAGRINGREELLDALRGNLAAISETPVGSIMNENHSYAHPEDLLILAGERIVQQSITALPVVDAEKVLVGEISRRMILHFLVHNL